MGRENSSAPTPMFEEISRTDKALRLVKGDIVEEPVSHCKLSGTVEIGTSVCLDCAVLKGGLEIIVGESENSRRH